MAGPGLNVSLDGWIWAGRLDVKRYGLRLDLPGRLGRFGRLDLLLDLRGRLDLLRQLDLLTRLRLPSGSVWICLDVRLPGSEVTRLRLRPRCGTTWT